MQDIIIQAQKFGLSIDENIARQLSRNAVVSLSNSSGKDSVCMSARVVRFLRSIDYQGDIIGIHSDLGIIEHAASRENVLKLGRHLGLEMVVIKPPRPMLEVWEYRWIGIIERFLNLRRVKIITPWSNSVWRFCTKSTKTAPITQYLKKRFPGREIINAVGIRREESENRRKKPISESCDELYSVKLRTSGILWYPIIELPIEEVWLTHQAEHFPRHEVYDKLGMSRVSCSFCVLASLRDLALSLNDPRNHPAFHRIVELEIKSGFSFQDGQWLSDIGFDHLSDDQKRRLEKAKELAGKRWIIEKDCPKSLTIIDNYPPYQPDMIESEMMADYRRRLCELMGIEGRYLTALSVYDRFAELLAEKEAKQQKKAAAAARKAAKALAAGIIIDVPKNEKAKKEAELPLFA